MNPAPKNVIIEKTNNTKSKHSGIKIIETKVIQRGIEISKKKE